MLNLYEEDRPLAVPGVAAGGGGTDWVRQRVVTMRSDRGGSDD